MLLVPSGNGASSPVSGSSVDQPPVPQPITAVTIRAVSQKKKKIIDKGNDDTEGEIKHKKELYKLKQVLTSEEMPGQSSSISPWPTFSPVLWLSMTPHDGYYELPLLQLQPAHCLLQSDHPHQECKKLCILCWCISS